MTEAMRVLLVEDEALIAMELEDLLVERGFEVAFAKTVMKASQLVEEFSPAIVILDMQLRGEVTFDLATDLDGRGIPFFFVSGNDAAVLPAHLASHKILSKPVRILDVVNLIAELTDS